VGVAGATAALTDLLEIDVPTLTAKFTKPGTRYVIVKKNVNPTAWREIRALGIPGIGAERTAARVYPTGMAMGQLVGIVKPSDQTAAFGVEVMLNKTLSGTPGTTVAEQARDGHIIPGSDRVDTEAVDGRAVRLTIDSDLQWFAQNAVAKQVDAVGAESGTVVVLETATGKVRAAASYPSFDPNNLTQANRANLGNVAFNDAFEPGSTGKLMTLAAALEEKKITPDTGVIVPNRLARGGGNFKDNENHAVEQLTATGVIAKSSNIGTILIGERVAPATMDAYYRKFGVGQRTDVNFDGESSGQLAPAAKWGAQQRYGVLFGQGYSTTAVQATGIYQTIANGGVRMSPTLVEGAYNDSGTFVPAPAPQGTRVVSTDTATELSRMIEEVTGTNGTAMDARIKGYRVAGKTGTSDRYDDKLKRYNGFTASFIGYAPAEKSKYVVGVFIQKPSSGMFGGALAGPVFNQVMTYLIERDDLAPSTPSPLTYHVFAQDPLSDSDPTVLSNAQAKRDGL
ncbi:MAG: penicillin-binding protein 2, partial [Dermatophilaceae bacterium]